MKMNKKGFTIVELVVVIVVIAILAAVLIPTFVGLVRKANIANDTAIAKNLNTAAISAQAKTFDEALAAAKESGYLVANLNAKADKCYFVWEDDTDQFLLYDLKEKEIIYSNSKVTGDPDDSWCFITSSKDDFDEVTTAFPNATCKLAIADYDDLNEMLSVGGEQTFYIDESLEIAEGDVISVTTAGSNITLNLGASSISTNGTINGAPIYVKEDATLSVVGGTLHVDGKFTNVYGTFNCAIGYDGNATKPTKLYVDGTSFIGTTGINGSLNYDGDINLFVKNSTFDVTSGGVILSCGNLGKATIEDCTINAGRYAIFTSQGGNITVSGGSYKGGTAVLYVQDTGSKIVVDGGDFDGKLEITNGATLEIKGGTFRNTGLELDAFKAYVVSGKTVTENADGSWSVN